MLTRLWKKLHWDWQKILTYQDFLKQSRIFFFLCYDSSTHHRTPELKNTPRSGILTKFIFNPSKISHISPPPSFLSTCKYSKKHNESINQSCSNLHSNHGLGSRDSSLEKPQKVFFFSLKKKELDCCAKDYLFPLPSSTGGATPF